MIVSTRCLQVALALCLAGCADDRELPRTPRADVVLNPPAEITPEYDGQWTATANGQDLTEPISVGQGEILEIDLDPTALVQSLVETRPQYTYLIEVRLLPEGSSDEDWVGRDYPDFADIWFLGMNSSPPPHNVTHAVVDTKSPPGVYDARIYLVGQYRYEYNPTIELLGKTTVTITD